MKKTEMKSLSLQSSQMTRQELNKAEQGTRQKDDEKQKNLEASEATRLSGSKLLTETFNEAFENSNLQQHNAAEACLGKL